STYQAVQFPLQQPNSNFNSYSLEQSTVTEAPSNYILESQNSSRYTKHSVQLSTPLYSPTNTATNYFDLRPNRSVKSESAASMLSSSRGSPLMGLESSSSWTPVGSSVFHQNQYDHQILLNDTFNYAALSLPEKPGCVDPTLIQPLSPTPPTTTSTTQMHSDSKHLFPHPPSPTPSSGTMVCGFCPGSGSSAEKSFNRADVFKRHLTSVHGVEQTAPNARRRSGGSSSSKSALNKIGITGMCSTCGVAFANVQDFYEHLDDCVLRVIQQGDPCEAINERILSSMIDDKAVRDTLERHSLSNASNLTGPPVFDDDEEDDDDEERYIKDETSSPVLAN
ncbi:hypothetical protein KCU68_g20553, partial [Aureobasidium melanogenum]